MAPHVLIVEDEKLLAKAIAATLRNAGLDVTVAHNGDEALELVRQLHPDVVLLDVMLPGKSGIDICATMKTQPLTADIPVIMVSARSTPQDRMRGLIAGAEQYLTKPFSPTELLELIHHVLQGRSGRDWQGQKPILGAMPTDQLVIYAEELSQLYRQIRQENAELERLHQQLKETARLKDAFFKAVAQDIGALLFPLQRALQQLDEQPQAARKALEHLTHALGQYVKTLVELINLTARPAVPPPVRYNLLKTLPWVVQAHILESQARGVNVRTHWPDRLPVVIGDMDLTQAALEYLFVNALHVVADQGELTVRAFSQQEGETLQVVVQMTSTPVRVPAEVLLRLAASEILSANDVTWALQLMGWSLRWSFLRYVSALQGGRVRLFQPGESCTLLLALPAKAEPPAGSGAGA